MADCVRGFGFIALSLNIALPFGAENKLRRPDTVGILLL